ncbi:MAG TPA: hypothetical protein PKG74_01095 [Candidatus Colwellbacteria bacterium]|nr:hypothetical protein [Candidatus Colwellbacteria bacterium]
MKTKKDILSELIDEVKETLIRIEITTRYVEKKQAETQKDRYLQELAKLQANKEENEDWLKFLEEELKNTK